MAELIIETRKIQENIKGLSAFFGAHHIYWSLVTKVFSGDLEFLKHILTSEVIKDIYSVGDSRLTSLKNLKKVNPNMRTIYIKPPAITYAEEVVRYADISLNSSYETLVALNQEAAKQKKIHQVIIMIELGELREGVNLDDFMGFYESVFHLPNIDVIGIGSNLGCMYGIEPSYEKLMELSKYREEVSQKFNKELKLLSGGSSITLPLIETGQVPKDVNHFRVGEAAFFGVSPLKNEPFQNLHTDTFEFDANIIELEEKKMVPEGIMSDGNIGHTAVFDEADAHKTTFKAILDFGILDVDVKDIETKEDGIEFVGVTSDMIVLDLGENKKTDGSQRFHTGDKIRFTCNYMAVARLLNSKFIDKRFV